MNPPIRLQCLCGNFLAPLDRTDKVIRAECVGCGERWIVTYDNNGNLLHVARDERDRANETRPAFEVESTRGSGATGNCNTCGWRWPMPRYEATGACPKCYSINTYSKEIVPPLGLPDRVSVNGRQFPASIVTHRERIRAEVEAMDWPEVIGE